MSSEFFASLFSLHGKTAIVTGGTGGLGKAMTVGLAKAGATIVSIELPNDPLSEKLVEEVTAAGSTVTAFHCDVANAKSLRQCYASIWEKGITPDILLNCAGVMRRDKIEDAKDEDIDLVSHPSFTFHTVVDYDAYNTSCQLLNINLKAVYISAQEVGRRLIHLNKPGKIINISSVTSFQANVNTSVYSTTKGGVLQMTKALSNEWSSKGIQVNAIAPG
jgi:2-deoxy-D-gluconate 3-dehydrogenase